MHLEAISNYIVRHHWGDYASVVGIPLTLWGLYVTYVAARQAKEEAKNAQEAVAELRTTLALVDTIADLTNAVAMMEEIKRLHRTASWPVLPDRYAELRKRLIAINTASPQISDDQRSALQNALVQFVTMEKDVEQALAAARTPKNPARYNEVVSEQLDMIVVVLTAIRQSIGA